MQVGYKSEAELQQEEKLTVLADKSSSSNKYVVWHIEGGLGKNVAATALISAVQSKYKDRKLILVVSYPEMKWYMAWPESNLEIGGKTPKASAVKKNIKFKLR